MTFRTFYTVYTENGDYENVESFEEQGSFLRIEYYPKQDIITSDIIRIKPDAKYIPMSDVIDIDERQVRF